MHKFGGYALVALLASGCGATRPHLEPSRPWHIATEAMNHPPSALEVPLGHLANKKNEAPTPVDQRLHERVTLRSEATDIRSLLLGLSKQTGMNIILDPDVTGTVSAYCNDVEVIDALRQVVDQLGYELEFKDNFVRVHRPQVDTRIYRLHYLRGERKGQTIVSMLDRSSAATGTGVSAAPGGSGGSGGGAPGGTATPGMGAPTSAMGGAPGTPGAQITPSVPGGGSQTDVASTFVANFWEDLGNELESLIFEGAKDDEKVKNNRRSAGMSVSDKQGRSLTVNSMSGTIVVRANRKVLDTIGEYLDAVENTIRRQVVIDVRILEVSLSDSTQFGIESKNMPFLPSDSLAGTPLEGATTQLTTPLGQPDPGKSVDATFPNNLLPLTASPYGFTIVGADGWKLAVNALGQLGDVRTVAAPRITALHNQKAIVKVVRDRVFFLFQQTGTVVSNGAVVNGQTQFIPIVVPEGIVLDVTPLIDDDGSVTLEIHPSFSVIFNEKKLPGQDLGSQPEVERREFQTTVRVQGEQTVVLGGLITERTVRRENGLPYLKDIPYLGALFRRTEDTTEKAELVLLLTPRIQGPELVRESVNRLREISNQSTIGPKEGEEDVQKKQEQQPVPAPKAR